MRCKLVIFDFDGTLADTFPWFMRTINDVADRYRFKRIEPHEVEMLRGMGAAEIMAHLGVPRWKLPLIANHMRQRKAREIGETRLFDGVERMLARLHEAGVKAAVVSSNSEANVRAILGPALTSRIACFECGASVFGKAARFRKVLRRSGISPPDALCIGDEIRDLEAARRAGIAFGAAGWGFTRPEALQARGPNVLFSSLDEIADSLIGDGQSPLAPAVSAS
jgi:phosphoglycolate phosphatase